MSNVDVVVYAPTYDNISKMLFDSNIDYEVAN